MPIFAALFVSIFGQVTAIFAAVLGRKIAVAAAAVASLAVLYVALMVSFNTIVQPLIAGMFATAYGQALGLAFPPAAGNCLAALALAWSVTTAFAWKKAALKLAASS